MNAHGQDWLMSTFTQACTLTLIQECLSYVFPHLCPCPFPSFFPFSLFCPLKTQLDKEEIPFGY